MRKKVVIPKQTTAYAYTGTYANKSKHGQLGWFIAPFLGDKRYPGRPSSTEISKYHKFTRLFLCKIVLTPVKDKNGRPLTMIVKRREPENG